MKLRSGHVVCSAGAPGRPVDWRRRAGTGLVGVFNYDAWGRRQPHTSAYIRMGIFARQGLRCIREVKRGCYAGQPACTARQWWWRGYPVWFASAAMWLWVLEHYLTSSKQKFGC